MRGTWFVFVATAAVISAAAAPAAPAKHITTPAERCTRLDYQLSQVLKAKSAAKNADAASALQKQGIKLCYQKKWAQGLRSYASAFRLLDARPIGFD